MSDEPGSSATDEEKAHLMLRLVLQAMDVSSADGRAGMGAILRELQAVDPEAVRRLSALTALRKAGPPSTTAH